MAIGAAPALRERGGQQVMLLVGLGRLATGRLDPIPAAGTGDAPGGADQVVARLNPASRAREGQQLRLWFDPSKLHLFNPDNGAHLTL
jgi:multiple sugar transport system ATP-binding protein